MGSDCFPSELKRDSSVKSCSLLSTQELEGDEEGEEEDDADASLKVSCSGTAHSQAPGEAPDAFLQLERWRGVRNTGARVASAYFPSSARAVSLAWSLVLVMMSLTHRCTCVLVFGKDAKMAL